MGMREKIHEVIEKNKEYCFTLLKDMVAYDSRILENGKYGKEKGIQDYLKQRFAQMGAEVDAFSPNNDEICGCMGYNANHDYKDRENVVATFKGTGKGRSILLNGHCDIVPPGDKQLWSNDPFNCVEREGRFYGRGTTDMKGGLAAAILAVDCLQKAGVKLAGDIFIESVIDEEGGGNGTIACCVRGYKADGAIIMEPTQLTVMPCNRGAFLAEFAVTGVSSHASTKGWGVNAIEKAVKLIEALHELEDKWLMTKRHPLLGNPTINIGHIEGGIGASIVPEKCVVKFDVEFLPSEYDHNYKMVGISSEDIKREVEECLHRACQGDEWLCEHPVSVNWFQETLCFETDISDSFVQSVIESEKEVMGDVTVAGLPCGCDGAQLAKIGNMPVLILGPGDLHCLHTTDESMDKELFFQAIEVYANIIVNWVGIVEEQD